MSGPDLGRLFDDLVRVETRTWNAVDARLGERHQLTLARFEVMRVVADRSPCRVQDIADRLAVTWGGASKIVDRIAAAGHCRRRPNPADARSSLITLTRQGRVLLDAARVTVDTELRLHLASALTADQLAALAETVELLRNRSDLIR